MKPWYEIENLQLKVKNKSRASLAEWLDNKGVLGSSEMKGNRR